MLQFSVEKKFLGKSPYPLTSLRFYGIIIRATPHNHRLRLSTSSFSEISAIYCGISLPYTKYGCVNSASSDENFIEKSEALWLCGVAYNITKI